MASNSVRFLRAETKRLQSLVAKLTGNNEVISLQLKQKEDALAKRRIEVATLHQACAKYKRARVRPVQRASPISPAVPPSMSSLTIEAVCLRCQKAIGVFGELKEAVDAFTEKLNTTLAAKEVQFEEQLNTALKEKDNEIEKLANALAKKKRKEQERRARVERQKAEERQEYEDTMREMAEMQAQQQEALNDRLRVIEERKLQHQRENAQRLREIEEEHVRRVHAIHQRAVVQSRQRRGVADAA